jgi:hypothetical protein
MGRVVPIASDVLPKTRVVGFDGLSETANSRLQAPLASMSFASSGALHAPAATHCAYAPTVIGVFVILNSSTCESWRSRPDANPDVTCPPATLTDSGISSAFGPRTPWFSSPHPATTSSPRLKDNLLALFMAFPAARFSSLMASSQSESE